jgi:carbon starvation protein
MHALPLLVGALCVIAIAYRYYSAFIATKVLVLDDARITPAHRLADGHNFIPTNRWVVFGHHFAAITGAGPLVGPTLAAQFGWLPGYLWILIGVALGGAVHDFVVLVGSIRHDGQSLATIARAELSRRAGVIAATAILFITVLAIAAMAKIVVNALSESAWGAFTIGMTIPIALVMGVYLHRIRPGKIAEATMFGVIALFAAVVGGRFVASSSWAAAFLLSEHKLTIAIAIYGFAASILPVWLLLAPRDYLSSYMKIGTILFIVVGVLIVNPVIHAPALSRFTQGGPIVPGGMWPFVFITIACGAISGFHGLIASGTTPKLLDRESDARPVAYGAMLIEGLVAVVALIAASSMAEGDYFAINAAPDKFAALGMSMEHLPELSRQIGERLAGRAGGAVSLAVGVSQIFSGVPGLKHLIAYWYHFAIMFEALFILTTVDAGTRVARFCLQESLASISPRWARADYLPSALLTTLFVCIAWGYLVWSGSVSTLWPLLGISNQLLACIALATMTGWLINNGRARYAWVTLLPLAFVGVATETAGYQLLTRTFIPKLIGSGKPELVFQGWVVSAVCVVAMLALFLVLVELALKWRREPRA